MSGMTGDGEGPGKAGIPEVEEIFGVRRHKNSVTMQTAGIALGKCREELESGKAELERTRADNAVLKPLLNYALGETGLRPGDVDRLIGMAKAGGSEKENVKAYLEKIKDDRNY